MENSDERGLTSSLNEDTKIIIRQNDNDRQRRGPKQDEIYPQLHTSTQQKDVTRMSFLRNEEKGFRRRSADTAIQGENATSSIASNERQKKANKRRSVAGDHSPALSSSPTESSAEIGRRSKNVSGAIVSRGKVMPDIHSSADVKINDNGSSNEQKVWKKTSSGGEDDSDIEDTNLGTSKSPSVLNATIQPLLSEVKVE